MGLCTNNSTTIVYFILNFNNKKDFKENILVKKLLDVVSFARETWGAINSEEETNKLLINSFYFS